MKDNCNFVHLLSIVIESAINVKCSFYVIFIYLDCLDYFWDIYTFCPNVYAHVPSSFEAVIKARANFRAGRADVLDALLLVARSSAVILSSV